MNALKYVRLREEGSLNERTFKIATVQKCDWAYEDFQTAEMVPDSTMRMLQGRFRKEDDKNTCLQKSVDTPVTVGRIVRCTREQHKLHCAGLYEKSEQTTCSIIAKVVDKVVEKYIPSMGLSDSLKFWLDLDDWCHPSQKKWPSYSRTTYYFTNSGIYHICLQLFKYISENEIPMNTYTVL